MKIATEFVLRGKCGRLVALMPHRLSVSANPVRSLCELIPGFSTIEYTITRAPCLPPVFLFVIDTSMNDEEFGKLKDSLQMSLNLMVQLHELGTEC